MTAKNRPFNELKRFFVFKEATYKIPINGRVQTYVRRALCITHMDISIELSRELEEKYGYCFDHDFIQDCMVGKVESDANDSFVKKLYEEGKLKVLDLLGPVIFV